MRLPYDREILDLFTAVRHHTELDHAGRLLGAQQPAASAPSSARWLHFSAMFLEQSRTPSSFRRGCNFKLDDLGYEFPRYPVPDGETMDSFLRKRVEEGVMRRYGPKRDRCIA